MMDSENYLIRYRRSGHREATAIFFSATHQSSAWWCCRPLARRRSADLTLYASAHGLSGTIIDAGSDEAQNIWAVTPDTLYVLRPGQTTFTPFTAANGLHIQSITDTTGTTVSNITALAGGHSNEVFLGYRGYEATIPPPAPPSCCEPNADFSDPRWHLGQADKVTLNLEPRGLPPSTCELLG